MRIITSTYIVGFCEDQRQTKEVNVVWELLITEKHSRLWDEQRLPAYLLLTV